MNATLHLRDGRTIELTWDKLRFVYRTIYDTTDDLFLIIYHGCRVELTWVPKLLIHDLRDAVDDLDPDYVDLPNGGRYTWPREEMT